MAYAGRFMKLALEQARFAALAGEVPVGAVVCHGEDIIAAVHNQRESDKNALAHAELLAIDTACKVMGGWRLFMCDLYVTLEPCPMCAGAIINSRIRRVVFGAHDHKSGCFGSITDFSQLPFNHHPEVIGGICAAESSKLLTDFFSKRRT